MSARAALFAVTLTLAANGCSYHRGRFSPVETLIDAGLAVVTSRRTPASPELRLRITASRVCDLRTCRDIAPSRFEGRMLWLGADSLGIYSTDHERDVVVPADGIVLLEVYRGRGNGSVERAIGFAMVGAAVGASTLGMMELIIGGAWEAAEPEKAMATGAILGGVTGAIAGATAGPPVWQPTTLLRLRQQRCGCQDPDAT